MCCYCCYRYVSIVVQWSIFCRQQITLNLIVLLVNTSFNAFNPTGTEGANVSLIGYLVVLIGSKKSFFSERSFTFIRLPASPHINLTQPEWYREKPVARACLDGHPSG